jgi:hypothetical protein
MKKMFVVTVIALLCAASAVHAARLISVPTPVSSSATADVVPTQVALSYTCTATNGYGAWGYGTAATSSYACRRALRECAVWAHFTTTCYVYQWYRSG